MALVNVEDFSFSYQTGDAASRTVLDGVSLSIEEGEFCVLVGPTGCGKTTLLRSLKPELAPVGACGGSIEVLG